LFIWVRPAVSSDVAVGSVTVGSVVPDAGIIRFETDPSAGTAASILFWVMLTARCQVVVDPSALLHLIACCRNDETRAMHLHPLELGQTPAWQSTHASHWGRTGRARLAVRIRVLLRKV
jgi:hypothetical protein